MIKYQFQVDGRPAGRVRDKWEQAAQDAVNSGMAVWWGRNRRAVKLADNLGATIEEWDE